MGLTKDSGAFIECLRSNKVEFLIVGALAVSCQVSKGILATLTSS